MEFHLKQRYEVLEKVRLHHPLPYGNRSFPYLPDKWFVNYFKTPGLGIDTLVNKVNISNTVLLIS